MHFLRITCLCSMLKAKFGFRCCQAPGLIPSANMRHTRATKVVVFPVPAPAKMAMGRSNGAPAAAAAVGHFSALRRFACWKHILPGSQYVIVEGNEIPTYSGSSFVSPFRSHVACACTSETYRSARRSRNSCSDPAALPELCFGNQLFDAAWALQPAA